MQLYHVLNRGVDKRKIFLDNRDRARFVHDLWEFNAEENPQNVRRRLGMTGLRNPSSLPIVDLHGWCIMGNHYHLLLSERAGGGLTKFIRRLNVGYANYFNLRNRRTGTLFEGRTKKILIERESHFLYILHYIHLNPLDFVPDAREWRNGAIGAPSKALDYLATYRWSSYLDYCGNTNFPSVLTNELFSNVFKDYRKELSSYVSSLKGDLTMSYELE
ncbi:transposase [Candidatus Kaiserbacteria bacterium]|nr:transposase [Candidatus Kaiserbacteria bacterium]